MRVVGVIDLLRGQAVHARAGHREHYRPVVSARGPAFAAGDALGLGRAYIGELGVREIYVADLDAITGGRPQDEIIARLAALGAPLWVDAGTGSAAQAARVRALGASRVVVGLETLASYAALDGICAAVGGRRIAFSLDTRGGEPIVQQGGSIDAAPLDTIAARAARAGVGAIIALDLARVGTGRGPDVDLIARLRAAVPDVALMAGGGVRDAADLDRLALAGCDGALVATALLSGQLTL